MSAVAVLPFAVDSSGMQMCAVAVAIGQTANHVGSTARKLIINLNINKKELVYTQELI